MEPVLQKIADILCGTLDNKEQVEAEIASGKQIHPYAKHVTALCNDKIINRPKDHPGIYILEESYYIPPGKTTAETEIKPLFFYITARDGNTALLYSMQIPEHIKSEDAVNANKDLVFNFNEIHPRSWGPAPYIWHDDEQCFTTDHEDPIGPGMTFRLTETLRDGELFVMESVKKDGVQITPYNTPIHYIKK
ncbi:hypothetical protein [Maribacter sp. 2210JD10-5]|uniref:hypothetical protein n=1 Tax=Maribacter sp. 2210JD10-5 TaxID=3386272 RepID=UPI0039BD2885